MFSLLRFSMLLIRMGFTASKTTAVNDEWSLVFMMGFLSWRGQAAASAGRPERQGVGRAGAECGTIRWTLLWSWAGLPNRPDYNPATARAQG